jgi:NADPH:quinone reductase
MRAAVCREYGPPEVVRIEDFAPPELGPGHVRVEAASVNFPDVLVVANQYQVSVPLPFVPGSELAGTVVEVRGDVANLAVGDRVFGSTMVGAFAEEVAVAAASLTRIPDGVAARHAAAFGVAHGTAYHALRSVARLEVGEQLIVLGAGGGVGLAAVQLGTLLGASVTAVASSAEKLAVAKTYGASSLVDYKAGDLRQALRHSLPAGADVVVDPVGGDVAEPALRSLRWGGRFITIGYASGAIPRIPLNLVLLKGIHILGFEMRGFGAHAPQEMQRNHGELLDLLGAQRVLPHIGAAFDLADTAAALRHVAGGRAIGKVVIEVAPGA